MVLGYGWKWVRSEGNQARVRTSGVEPRLSPGAHRLHSLSPPGSCSPLASVGVIAVGVLNVLTIPHLGLQPSRRPSPPAGASQLPQKSRVELKSIVIPSAAPCRWRETGLWTATLSVVR